MGPRHARVLGWAKSFTKALDQETLTSHDEDTVGVVSIVWSIIQSVMPRDVLDCVDNKLTELKLPRIATRNVEEGKSQIYTSEYPNLRIFKDTDSTLDLEIKFLNSLQLNEHRPKHIYLMDIKHIFIFIFIFIF